jgi:hypothetical protein
LIVFLLRVAKWKGGTRSVAQMIECLLCKDEVLNPNPSPTKKKKNKDQSKEERRNKIPQLLAFISFLYFFHLIHFSYNCLIRSRSKRTIEARL